MKECDTCQWHCTDKKRCKLDLPIEEINPMLLESVDSLMHDFYVFC
jgi:hypothetical protein